MDKTLEKLLTAFGVSGHEYQVREVISKAIKNKKAEVIEDKMGNLIVKVGQGTEKLMITAHMDQIGMIVTYIEETGLLRTENIGDFSKVNLGNVAIKFENGLEGAAICSEKEIFIDMALKDKKEAETLLKEGDVASLQGKYVEKGKMIVGPNMDDRIGCYILLTLINELENIDKQVYFVFSSQQQLGGRGARAAAYSIKPDKCLVIETEGSSDTINGKGNIKLGKGPVISIMDKSLIINYELKEEIEKAAEKSNIKLQYTVSQENTDGGLIQKECFGVKTAVISVPCRYMHSLTEMVDLQDVESTISLLKTII